MNKILFLDVDGVLNEFCGSMGAERGAWIKPECMARLDRVVAHTDARIVVSSTWRRFVHSGVLGLDGFRLLMRSHGMSWAHHIVGVTPDHGNLRDRGRECRRWIGSWAGASSGDRHVALDDMDLGFSACGIPLVQTDGRIGLTDADADRAIAILEGGGR